MLTYKIKKYKRSKHLRIIIHQNGEIIATGPKWVSKKDFDTFIESRREWINKALKNRHIEIKDDKITPADKKALLQCILLKLEHFNKYYKFSYNKVFIKNQKTLWGSCSSNGNLNFNYKVKYLPEDLQDYIIVHELCHLKEMNHSKKFWNLVEQQIPDYKNRVKGLKKVRLGRDLDLS